MKKFAYLFSLGGRIEWSGEDETTLHNRSGTEQDANLILDFVETSKVGSFIRLSTGEFVFRIE